MKLISSKDNPLYKHWYKIAQGKIKQEVLLEGVHLCQMWLEHYGQPERAIIRWDETQQGMSLERGQVRDSHVFRQETSKTGLATHPSKHADAQLQDLVQQLDDNRVCEVSPALFHALNSVPSPQAILFQVSITQEQEIPLPVNSAVYLDRIQDPGNLGTIIRTCAAAGIESIYLSPACVNAWGNKVLRSAQGAHFAVKLYSQVEAHWFFTHNRLPVYVTHLSERAQSLYATAFPEHIVWVFGNEGQGVSEEISAFADTHIFIPQSEHVESLNVGVACGIALFEQRRQDLLKSPR